MALHKHKWQWVCRKRCAWTSAWASCAKDINASCRLFVVIKSGRLLYRMQQATCTIHQPIYCGSELACKVRTCCFMVHNRCAYASAVLVLEARDSATVGSRSAQLSGCVCCCWLLLGPHACCSCCQACPALCADHSCSCSRTLAIVPC